MSAEFNSENYYNYEDEENDYYDDNDDFNEVDLGRVNEKSSLKIKVNPYCKINKIDITLSGVGTMKFYCQPFENLEKIKIKSENLSNLNLSNSLPFFKYNNGTIFQSLTELNLDLDYICYNDFKNLINNINKNNMPNLKKLILFLNSQIVSKDEYENFIIKLISLELELIIIASNNHFNGELLYTFEELKNIYGKIKYSDYENYKIKCY